MNLSRYNIEVAIDENLFIYNTFSNGVLKLDKEHAAKYKELKEEGNIGAGRNSELIETLRKGQMLIDDNIDEIERLRVMHYSSKYSSDNYMLTIAPTMKCNFVCPYCYEKGRNLHTMNRDIIDKTKEYIKNIKKVASSLTISWYGGEPLLAMNIIEELSTCAIDVFKENYFATMVTNGYRLTGENVKKLEKFKVKNIQITIDGPPDIHNKMRKLPNGQDTFFTILNNVVNALEIYPDLHVVIRVNTDKSNIDRVDEIIDYLKEYELDHKISIYLAPIDNINNTCETAENCFTNDEFAAKQLEYLRRNFNRGYNFIKLPEPNISICGAVSNSSVIIDAQGDFYKCWDDVSDEKCKLGNIKEEYETSKNYTKWILYDPFENEKCTECTYLPICMGGCPNQVIKTGNNKCAIIKNNVDEMIKLLYQSFQRRQQEKEK